MIQILQPFLSDIFAIVLFVIGYSIMNSFDSKSNSDSKKFSFDGKVLNSQLSALTTDCSSDSDSEDGKIDQIPNWSSQRQFGKIIDKLVSSNQTERAIKLVNEDQYLIPNTIIYTTILKGLSKNGDIKRSREILCRMKESQQTYPNLISFNTILFTAVQAGDFQEMDSIFHKEITQFKYEKDIISYSTYLKGLLKQKLTKKALRLHRNMKPCIHKDEIYYNTMLDGLLKNNDVENCEKIYQEMMNNNIEKSNVTDSILVKLLTKQGRFQESLLLAQNLKQPCLVVFTSLLQCCFAQKQFTSIQQIVDCASNVRRDFVFYTVLIKGLIDNKQMLTLAFDSLLQSLNENIYLHRDIYTQVLNTLCEFTQNRFKICIKLPERVKIQSFDKNQAEIYLLKICQKMREQNMTIEYNLYRRIIAIFYNKPIFTINQQNANLI